MKIRIAPLALLIGILSSSAVALEPLPDRAQVQRMNADLLLPDGSTLNVDVSFDCGSDYKNTAVMVMSNSGAQLIAAAYTHLYGESAGQSVMEAWQNKQNESDPRKPTYLFILAPREQNFDWQKRQQNKFNKMLSRVSISETSVDNFEMDSASPLPPVVLAGCGVRNHNPQAVE
ncbi:hypothetical protein [Pseudoalteromonas rubra]|uniref:Uncharacterized protein n=1 Tax=Pseudoalteromonas rubra TaxID=43658 RepID=A0A0U3I4G7_9GAMM|nr:hypothetical protein [Pseudoalteromonas rubra]ALU41927.1 hypothetical protein AT705_02675 [Pseudoalteromonas rubra]MEC4091822.1 hypothetical protein [Pseudoalteromonas rubra]